MINYNQKLNKEYRLGKLVRADGIRVSFRYNILNHIDIQSIKFLTNVERPANSVTIRTTTALNFKVNDKVVINTGLYRVSSAYEEYLDNYDGPIRSNPTKVKYLILIQ